MTFELWDARAPYRTLIMVSKQLHCLNDLLFRHSNGSLQIEIPLVVSNHRDAEPLVRSYGLEFRHIPVTPETKPEAEAELLRAARGARHPPRRAGPLHAGALRRRVPPAVGPGDQHPPLVPAELQGRQALPPGLRPRREADRGDGALRDRRPRRGPDHRAGRDPRRPRPRPGPARRRRPRRRGAGALPRRALALGVARAASTATAPSSSADARHTPGRDSDRAHDVRGYSKGTEGSNAFGSTSTSQLPELSRIRASTPYGRSVGLLEELHALGLEVLRGLAAVVDARGRGRSCRPRRGRGSSPRPSPARTAGRGWSRCTSSSGWSGWPTVHHR